MKRFVYFMSLLAMCGLLALTSACKTSGEARSERKSLLADTPATDMAELLRRQPNIIVNGSGNNVKLQIRGSRRMTPSGGVEVSEPMIMVNGIRMGNGYQPIATLNPADVERLNIISDPATLASYGLGAASGVIEIFLKN